ncbi:Multidrug efflux pump subunit AcrA (membrane-fusion protein) [Chitinophaga rupis]|uniref:Multidrug efflux pump subunit AcrA (Membrane-fusion protein) n=1 Tax=Chitinophaga rupis TaxID=573321 RepID=A0A1H7QGW1_9BACT|nr:efflux RND transporter periplasmic adaptor subunit [Chitinophaga rupis]SEL46988.1 Multidrug efflux pump subunit AcrA (membrane-fusion protein) [Chitinophaga rupis]
MKKNYIVNISFGITLLLAACKQHKPQPVHDHAAMEHSATIDSSLAPLLQPVNEQVVAQISTIQPEQREGSITKEIQGVVTYDTRSETSIASRVAGRIEKLYIKYNYQPVKKGQLIMQVYSPDLVAAQRELLFIQDAGDNPALLNSARQRLLLLGMTAQQIEQVIRTKQPLYRVSVYSNANGYIIDKAAPTPVIAAATASAPAGGDGMGGMNTTPAAPAASTTTTPVLLREGQYVSAGENLFTIYKADKLVGEFALEPATAALVRKGQSLSIQGNNNQTITGAIGLVQPVFRNGENFTLVRVYLQGQPFSAGALLKASIPLPVKKAWWLPEAAVLQLGQQSVVFKKEGTVYKPIPITTGVKANGRIQVPDSIAGWNIARNAYYLVDSESFIKAAATNK